MKQLKKLALCALFIMIQKGFAADYLLKFNSNYTYNFGQSNFVKAVVSLTGIAPAIKDSFLTDSGKKELLLRFTAPDNLYKDIKIELFSNTNQLLFTYDPQLNPLTYFQCSPNNYKLFGGSNCVDFSIYNSGNLCLEFDYVGINSSSTIKPDKIRSHWFGWGNNNDWRIYCDAQSNNPEELVLKAPCVFRLYNKSENQKWFESETPTGPWVLVAEGDTFAPVRHSYKQGELFYNKKRYYKTVVDVFQITGKSNVSSEIVGPVEFFLGVKRDSIVYKPGNCKDTSKEFIVYSPIGTDYQTSEGIRIIVREFSDPANQLDYYFGGIKNEKTIKLEGRIPFNPFNVNSPVNNKPFHLKNGKYRILVDYTPWNGYNCKLIWDTFIVTGAENYVQFSKDFKNPLCYQSSDAWVLPQARNVKPWDTVKWGLDGIAFPNKLGDTLKNLKSGNYQFYFKNSSGCIKSFSQQITDPPKWINTLGINKKICAGQEFYLNAKIPNAKSTIIKKPNGVEVHNDTLWVDTLGVFSIVWTDSLGCTAHDTAFVDTGVWKNNLHIDTAICEKEAFSFDASHPNQKQFGILFPDGSTQNNSIVSPKLEGNYVLQWQDYLGCKAIDTVKIKREIWKHELKIDTTLCIGQKLFLSLKLPRSKTIEVQDPFGNKIYTDTLTIANAGTHNVLWTDAKGCEAKDQIKVKRSNIEVVHDFLIPSQAFITDSVFAVDHSQPKADALNWSYDKPIKKSQIIKQYTNNLIFPDTGKYWISLHSRYSGCGFTVTKPIVIFGGKDSSKTNDKLGYKGPLIKSFTIGPNPHNGVDYTAKVVLREKANITVYKIDPISGNIIGDLSMTNKDEYSINQFVSYSDEVYFLKVIAGSESKTIKVVVIK